MAARPIDRTPGRVDIECDIGDGCARQQVDDRTACLEVVGLHARLDVDGSPIVTTSTVHPSPRRRRPAGEFTVRRA